MPRAFSLLIRRGLHLASTWLPSSQEPSVGTAAASLLEKTMMWSALLESPARSLPSECITAPHAGASLSTVTTVRHLSSRFVCFASLAPFGRMHAGVPWSSVDGRVLLEAISLIRFRFLTVESRLCWLARWEEALGETSAAVLRSDGLHCVRVLCYVAEGTLPWSSLGNFLRRSLVDGLRAAISTMPLATIGVTLRALNTTHAARDDEEVLFSLVTPLISRMTTLMRTLPPPPFRRGLVETAMALQSVVDPARCPATGVAELLGELLGRESGVGAAKGEERAKCIAAMSHCASETISNAFVSGFLRPPVDNAGGADSAGGGAVLVERLCVVSVFGTRRKGLVRLLRSECMPSRGEWSLDAVKSLATAAIHLTRSSGFGQPEAEDIAFFLALEQCVLRHAEVFFVRNSLPPLHRTHERIALATAVLRAVVAVFELDEVFRKLRNVPRAPATTSFLRNGDRLASAAAVALGLLSAASSLSPEEFSLGGDGDLVPALAIVAATLELQPHDARSPVSGREALYAALAALVHRAPVDGAMRWMDAALTMLGTESHTSRFAHVASTRSGFDRAERTAPSSTVTSSQDNVGLVNRRRFAAWWTVERVAQCVGDVLRENPDAVDGVTLDMLSDQVLRLHRILAALPSESLPPQVRLRSQGQQHPVVHRAQGTNTVVAEATMAGLPTARCRKALRDVWLRVQSHASWNPLKVDARLVAAASGLGSGAVAVRVALSELRSLSALERPRQLELLLSCAEILSTPRHWLAPCDAAIRGELLLRFLECDAEILMEGCVEEADEGEDRQGDAWVKQFFERCVDDPTWLEDTVPLPGLLLLLAAVDRIKSSPVYLAMRDITLTALGRHVARFHGVNGGYPVDMLLAALVVVHGLRVAESSSSLQHTVNVRLAASASISDDAITRCAAALLGAMFSLGPTDQHKRELTLALTIGLLVGVRDEELQGFAAQLPRGAGNAATELAVADASPKAGKNK